MWLLIHKRLLGTNDTNGYQKLTMESEFKIQSDLLHLIIK